LGKLDLSKIFYVQSEDTGEGALKLKHQTATQFGVLVFGIGVEISRT